MIHYKRTLPTRVSVLGAIMIVAAIAHSKLRKTFRGWKVKRKPIFIYLGFACFFSKFFLYRHFISIPSCISPQYSLSRKNSSRSQHLNSGSNFFSFTCLS